MTDVGKRLLLFFGPNHTTSWLKEPKIKLNFCDIIKHFNHNKAYSISTMAEYLKNTEELCELNLRILSKQDIKDKINKLIESTKIMLEKESSYAVLARLKELNNTADELLNLRKQVDSELNSLLARRAAIIEDAMYLPSEYERSINVNK